MEKPEDPLKLCMNPKHAEIGKEADCRGLCQACYNACKWAVKKGYCSWEELEKRGKILPPQRGKVPQSIPWLLDWIKSPTRKRKPGRPKGARRGRRAHVPLIAIDPPSPFVKST